jgi:CheY-like chemotaxis protein
VTPDTTSPVGGGSGTVQLRLSGAAPSGGASVSLSSSNTGALHVARRLAPRPPSRGEVTLAESAPRRLPDTACQEEGEIEVVVVDDHPGVRSAIEALIARAAGLCVVGSVSSGTAAVAAVVQLRPTVVIMDLCMPGMNGVEATRAICSSPPAPVVVVFSGSRELWREARAAGAAHMILKDEDPESLLEAIRAAARR